ncbi:hypothetical protein V6N13_042566 [Hibiscus sabdariffa]|uniref:Uncharacterized protein n=1 Tax=Hibiscus sabdariffa TaxID=183260 RepID=A0ABR2G4J3_9ROSI
MMPFGVGRRICPVVPAWWYSPLVSQTIIGVLEAARDGVGFFAISWRLRRAGGVEGASFAWHRRRVSRSQTSSFSFEVCFRDQADSHRNQAEG